MKRRSPLLIALGLLSVGIVGRSEDAERPNFVFIMADDLGNADLGYRGGEIQTPNIDKLATSGVRCESFYGMPPSAPPRGRP